MKMDREEMDMGMVSELKPVVPEFLPPGSGGLPKPVIPAHVCLRVGVLSNSII